MRRLVLAALAVGCAGSPHRSRNLATGLSVAGALAPLPILAIPTESNHDLTLKYEAAAGVALIAPSLGHWYAGDPASTGLGLRLAGVAIGALGFSMMLETDDGSPAIPLGLFLGGVLLCAGGAAYDLLSAQRAADAWNHAHTSPAISVMKTAGGYGLGVVGVF